MPASVDFKERLYPVLKDIASKFKTPFHIYDEQGIVENCERFKYAFAECLNFKEFFAVKACPNPSILKILLDRGFGFDCSSIPELLMCRTLGARGDKIMFTSNNTSMEEFEVALADGGCILNLDDISFISKLPKVPELICFRYNPGARRDGNVIIGNPVEAKYGVCDNQIIDAYRLAKERGIKKFGFHTMICSNQLDYKYMVETISMSLEVMGRISNTLGIKFQFINAGGGIGIPYRLDQKPFDLNSFADEACELFKSFAVNFGYMPRLFLECGRYITGPYGVLVTKVINRMSKYQEYVGVDVCMSSLMRPALYGAYHHIEVLDGDGRGTEIVDVVGSLCENNDKFAIKRQLPITKEGDILIIHDTGAHGYAMGFQYNGRLRPKELLLGLDRVSLIRREESYMDYCQTFFFNVREMEF